MIAIMLSTNMENIKMGKPIEKMLKPELRALTKSQHIKILRLENELIETKNLLRSAKNDLAEVMDEYESLKADHSMLDDNLQAVRRDRDDCYSDGAELQEEIKQLMFAYDCLKAENDALLYETHRDSTGDWVIVIKRYEDRVDASTKQTHMCSRSFWSEKHAREYARVKYASQPYQIICVGEDDE